MDEPELRARLLAADPPNCIIIKIPIASAVMQELESPGLIDRGGADVREVLEARRGLMIIQAIAWCLGAAARCVVPLQAVEYPYGVPGLGPPLIAIGMLWIREDHILPSAFLLGSSQGQSLKTNSCCWSSALDLQRGSCSIDVQIPRTRASLSASQ